MLYIRIHQINIDNDKCFRNLDFLKSFFKQNNPDMSDYNCKFEGKVAADDLEDVFQIFNVDHPDGYIGRSLSVSDIVEVVTSNGLTKPGYYFCDSYCWQEIHFE